jgi:hypothetical protein
MDNPLINLLVSILIVVYLLSARKMWKFYHIAYGPTGKWSVLKAGLPEVWFTYCPLMNTIAALSEWGNDGTAEYNNRPTKDYNHLFNIIKEDEESDY